MDADIARHAVPEPSDGELYLLKVPRFLAFEPTAFSHTTFQPPTTDHHSKFAASEHFSPYDTALSTIRWRRSPSNHAELQSNARVLRWSDGSFTLQTANDPTTQFDIDANTLAPPLVNPRIPTPSAVARDRSAKQRAEKESYTYLVAPYEEANVMRVTNKFTTALSVVPAANLKDAALEKLQNDLAAAATRGRDEADQAISFVDVNEDPDLRRQREEATFKERQRQARAREKHEARQAERANRTIGRSGVRTAGLSIGDLEDDDGASRPRKPRAKTGLRRDWSDDEDYGRGSGKTREDDYDEEDDFIAASDEEPEIVDDDDDLDEGIMASPKRHRGGNDDDDDDEVVVSRTKRRRVVDDDEDDE
jgi:RNA polymerase-associated protein LEO1